MFNFLRSINEYNSTLGVQCDAWGICKFRYTSLCDDCEHNCGMKTDLSYYKRKKIPDNRWRISI